MIRHGEDEYETIMGWIRELGIGAKSCVMMSKKPHAIYGRKMHDEDGRITEIRLYVDTYLDDVELDIVAVMNPMDTFYVAHK